MGLNEVLKIGNKLKALRKKDNLSQKEMAKELGINYTTYSNYENNNRTPSVKTLEKIADYFCINIEYFLYDAPIENTIESEEKYSDMIKNPVTSEDFLSFINLDRFGDFLVAYNIRFYAGKKDGELGKYFSFDGGQTYPYFLSNFQAEQLPDLMINQIKALILSADKLNKPN